MEGLRFDHWQTVAKFLTVRDQCRAMQVSRAWWSMWVDDRMWTHHEERVFSRYPELRELLHRPTETTKKRRRRFLIVPNKGTWWFFKKRLSLGFNVEGFKKLCNTPGLEQLAIAVAKSMVPPHSHGYEEVHMFSRIFFDKIQHGISLRMCNGKRIQFVSIPNYSRHNIVYLCHDGVLEKSYHNSKFFNSSGTSFKMWKCLVFGSTVRITPWTWEFKQFVK